MTCPFVHLCENETCREEFLCQNHDYWKDYWIAKGKTQDLASGLSKKEKRKARKAAKKLIGRKKFNREQKQVAKQEIYSSTPFCVKKGDWCDKLEACKIMNECIVAIPRIQANPHLMEFLRGPRTAKEIVRLLSQYDPEPMKSYYRVK